MKMGILQMNRICEFIISTRNQVYNEKQDQEGN